MSSFTVAANSAGVWNAGSLPILERLSVICGDLTASPTAALSALTIAAGILGALTGALGSLMALEVLREVIGFGEGLDGRLLMIDARAMRFETLTYAWDPENPLSGEHPTITDLSVHA